MDPLSDLQRYAQKERADVSVRFFKTGKGEYGEGDIFIGVTVPQTRAIAKKYTNLELTSLELLLKNKIHEARLLALLILVEKFKKSNEQARKEIVDFYLLHRSHINNWDLVDTSADKILGAYLLDKDKKLLYGFAKSTLLWERRIAMVSTFYFIRQKRFDDSFAIAKLLLNDTHDLIHKAVGWMLREIGKRDQKALETFLIAHYREMPRTMLRYAIEKFDKGKREFYMGRT